MAEPIIFRQISLDTARVPRSDQPFTATFFETGPYAYVDGSARVTEFDEKPIVRWLMLCPPAREVILDELRLPVTAFYKPEVVQPFYAPGEAEIDVVLCDRQTPHLALALECKRVKVETVNVGQDRLNKLQGVADGVNQANRLYDGRFAFFQTYLTIITEVEASLQGESNIPSRGVRSHTTPERGDRQKSTFRQIAEFPDRDKLHDSVGILFIEIVRPSHLSIDTQATIRVCVYRRADSGPR
jgi:hypothetical protein